MTKPKILVWDIETSPIIAHVWDLWDQNVGLNQIVQDWNIISFAAKWLDSDKIIYHDLRNAKSVHDDRKLLEKLWKLLNECDVSITQNGKSFDEKKANARFIINNFPPPSPYKSIDTKIIGKSKFKFTSNKQEYMSNALGGPPKLKHNLFPGHDLWVACLNKLPGAWDELKRYNIADVMGLEHNFKRMAPWDKNSEFNSLMQDGPMHVCSCGSSDFHCKGYAYTATGKFQRYRCCNCGKWSRGRDNLLSKEKRIRSRVSL